MTSATRLPGATSSTRTTLPLPGSGDTATRFLALWEGCRTDVSEGRLAEADHDADAESGGWLLDGVKPWCSGVDRCTHALVTARVDGRPRCGRSRRGRG